MKNGRCRMHGGPSTGPRTKEGLEAIRRARTIHGYYSQEQKQMRRDLRALMNESRELLREIEA